MDRMSNRDWIKRNTGQDISDNQARCLDTLVTAVDRIYNLEKYLAGKETRHRFQFVHDGLRVYYKGTVSTFDCSRLTRLVLEAHRNAVRVEISPRSQMSFEIWLTPRSATGYSWERHPSLEALGRMAIGEA